MISIVLTNKDRNKESLVIYKLFRDFVDDFIIIDGGDNPLELDCVVKDDGKTIFDAKKQGVKLSKNKWVLLLDSDDKFTKDFIDSAFKIKKVKNTIYIGGDEDLLLNLNDIKYKFPLSEKIEYLHKGNFLIEKSNYLKLTENVSNYADSLYVTIEHLINEGNIVISKSLNYKHNYNSKNSYTKINKRLFYEDSQKLINKIMNL